MAKSSLGSSNAVLKDLDSLLPDLETLYKDIHAHPELSMEETRTAGLAADRLRGAGYEVTTGISRPSVGSFGRNTRPAPVFWKATPSRTRPSARTTLPPVGSRQPRQSVKSSERPREWARSGPRTSVADGTAATCPSVSR